MEMSTLGVVIRETAYKENDKLITILSDTCGKITVLARGVKNISSKNAGAVQLFCYSEFELVENKGRYVLKTAISKDGFFGIRDDIEKYTLASYMLDVVSAVTTENADETGTYRLLLNTLYYLSNKNDNLDKIKAAFELRLMTESGFMPDLSSCSVCRNEEIKSSSRFLYNEAVVVCDSCIRDEQISFSTLISNTTLSAMKYIISSSISRFLFFNIDDNATAELGFVCENYLLNQTERNFKTLGVYKSVHNDLSRL